MHYDVEIFFSVENVLPFRKIHHVLAGLRLEINITHTLMRTVTINITHTLNSTAAINITHTHESSSTIGMTHTHL